jgi:hypothetical protein
MVDYKQKYLKYKLKYLKTKYGGKSSNKKSSNKKSSNKKSSNKKSSKKSSNKDNIEKKNDPCVNCKDKYLKFKKTKWGDSKNGFKRFREYSKCLYDNGKKGPLRTKWARKNCDFT